MLLSAAMSRNAARSTDFRGERGASRHARFGTSNAWHVLENWKKLNCCSRSFWDTPITWVCIRRKLVLADNIWAIFPKPSRTLRSSARRPIWTESFPARTSQCGAESEAGESRDQHGSQEQLWRAPNPEIPILERK